VLSVTEFNVRKLSPDGLMLWCRRCTRDYRRERKRQPLRSSPRPRLTAGQRAQVVALLEAGEPAAKIVTVTGVSVGSESRIRNGC
jgi:hypothetical protein